MRQPNGALHLHEFEKLLDPREDVAALYDVGADFIEQSHDDRRKVTSAADKIRRACDIVELLKDADENFAELSLRTLEQLDRVQSLLKSAEKKITKYGDEQMYRDIENWKQGGAS